MRLKSVSSERLRKLIASGLIAWQDLAKELPYGENETCPICNKKGEFVGEITGPMCAIVRRCEEHGHFWYWS